jgi:hypothetical protein
MNWKGCGRIWRNFIIVSGNLLDILRKTMRKLSQVQQFYGRTLNSEHPQYKPGLNTLKIILKSIQFINNCLQFINTLKIF